MAKMLVATALDLPEDEEDSSTPIIAATLRKPSSGNNVSNPSSVGSKNNTCLLYTSPSPRD